MMANFIYGIKDEGDVSIQRKEEEPSTDNVSRTKIEGIRQDHSKPNVLRDFLLSFLMLQRTPTNYHAALLTLVYATFRTPIIHL